MISRLWFVESVHIGRPYSAVDMKYEKARMKNPFSLYLNARW